MPEIVTNPLETSALTPLGSPEILTPFDAPEKLYTIGTIGVPTHTDCET